MEIKGFSEEDCLRVHVALMNALREMTVEEAEEFEQERR